MERCWRPLLNIKFHGDFRRNAEMVYKEHSALVRGAAQKENFLEWTVTEGWEPLCEFLNVPIPDEPFPRSNDAAGFQTNMDAHFLRHLKRAKRNFVLVLASLVAAGGYGYWRWAKGA